MTPPPPDRAAAEHPRRTSGARILLCLALMVLGPSGLILAGIVLPYRSPLSHGAGCLLLLALLGTALTIGRGWLRPRRVSRPRDAVPVLCLVIGAAAMLGISQLLAEAHGIQGSALPRVLQGIRHGVPLALDLLYLACVALSLLVLAVSLLIGLALLLHSGPVRSLRGRVRDRIAESAEDLADPEGQAVLGARPLPPIRTWQSQRYLRRHLSPVARLLLVLAAVTSAVCLLVFVLAAPPPDASELLTIAAAFAPLPGIVWAVLSSLWRRDEGLGIIMAALYRTVSVPVVAAVACFLPSALVSLLPPVWTGFSAHHLAVIGDDGLVGAGSPPIAFVGMAALACAGLGMVGGLAVSVAVVMPVVAIFWPDLAIRGNQMSTDPAHRRANVRAVRALVALVVMIFVFSVLIVDSDPRDLRFWLAMASLAVLVALGVVVYRTQRVDHAARRAGGTSALVPNPEDPDPARAPSAEQ